MDADFSHAIGYRCSRRCDELENHTNNSGKTDLDIDFHSLQIMIEQIRRWDGIVKIVGLLPHQNNLIKEK